MAIPLIFSASQGAMFLRCMSRWHFTYPQGFKSKPSQPMLDGTEIHLLVFLWLVYALIPPNTRNGDSARSLLRHLPPPSPDNLAEVKFSLSPKVLDFPTWCRGIIDLLTVEGDRLVVQDHKTRSNLKWALTATELLTDFQILFYALVAARAVKWTGDVEVRHNNVVRSKPHQVRVVSTVITQIKLAAFEIHARRTFGAMVFMAGLPIESVPYNVTACDDYKSRMNPDGCDHRHRCLNLGRKVGGDLAFFIGAEPMSNPMQDIIANAQGLGPIQAKILALAPDIKHADNANLPGVLLALQQEQGRLITELRVLGCGHEDTSLRSLSIPRLQELQKQYAQPRDVAGMTRADLIMEICQLRPDITPAHCVQDDNTLRASVTWLRTEAATDVGQTDPPDRAPEMVPPDVRAQVEASAPADPTKAPKDPTRALCLPEAYGGGLVSQENKSTGQLQKFLRDQGVEPAKRLNDIRTQVKDLLTGKEPNTLDGWSKVINPAAHASVPPAKLQIVKPPPVTDRLRALARLEALTKALGLPWDHEAASGLADTKIIQMITNMELAQAQLQQIPALKPASVFVLLIDCVSAGAQHTDVVNHPQLQHYTDAAQQWAAVAQFVQQIRSGQIQLQGNLYVSTRTPIGAMLAEALKPLADGRIISGDR